MPLALTLRSSRRSAARARAVVEGLLGKESRVPIRRPSPQVSHGEDQDFLFELEVHYRIREYGNFATSRRTGIRFGTPWTRDERAGDSLIEAIVASTWTRNRSATAMSCSLYQSTAAAYSAAASGSKRSGFTRLR